LLADPWLESLSRAVCCLTQTAGGVPGCQHLPSPLPCPTYPVFPTLSSPKGDFLPLVYIIPILHSAADMGSLAPSVGQRRSSRSRAQIDDFWFQLREAVLGLNFPLQRMRIYQDSLPCCGFEADLVKDLASQGSANFQLIAELLAGGAQIEGTESIDLLVEELNWAKRRVAFASQRQSAQGVALNSQEEDDDAPTRLLEARDRFIAQRILTTLREDEVGLVLIGMLHDVGAYLDPSLEVRYPLRIGPDEES
jgi:hypothetical protein